MAGLGLPAYGAALGIHFAVNYNDWRHIVPALIGLGLWLGGLALTHEYLGKEKRQVRAERLRLPLIYKAALRASRESCSRSCSAAARRRLHVVGLIERVDGVMS